MIKYRKKLLSLILGTILFIASATPAMAQRTTQRADRTQLIAMIMISVFSLSVLSYLRIP